MPPPHSSQRVFPVPQVADEHVLRVVDLHVAAQQLPPPHRLACFLDA
jgi:hypothetical protein